MISDLDSLPVSPKGPNHLALISMPGDARRDVLGRYLEFEDLCVVFCPSPPEHIHAPDFVPVLETILKESHGTKLADILHRHVFVFGQEEGTTTPGAALALIDAIDAVTPNPKGRTHCPAIGEHDVADYFAAVVRLTPTAPDEPPLPEHNEVGAGPAATAPSPLPPQPQQPLALSPPVLPIDPPPAVSTPAGFVRLGAQTWVRRDFIDVVQPDGAGGIQVFTNGVADRAITVAPGDVSVFLNTFSA